MVPLKAGCGRGSTSCALADRGRAKTGDATTREVVPRSNLRRRNAPVAPTGRPGGGSVLSVILSPLFWECFISSDQDRLGMAAPAGRNAGVECHSQMPGVFAVRAAGM